MSEWSVYACIQHKNKFLGDYGLEICLETLGLGFCSVVLVSMWFLLAVAAVGSTSKPLKETFQGYLTEFDRAIARNDPVRVDNYRAEIEEARQVLISLAEEADGLDELTRHPELF